MSKIIFQILIILTISLQCFSRHYIEMVYTEIIAKMKELSHKYPRFCKLFDVRNEYNHLIDTTCGKSRCEHWYLQITDFNLPTDKINTLPQVLFLGGIHGDEILGPNIIISLAEHLLEKNEGDEHITNMIKSRNIILLPMANPSGFSLRMRGEKQNDLIIDPNRDFPYNIKNGQCLRTSCARVINHLFKKYMFQAAITFHGGQQVIGYPWGAFNHLKGREDLAEECPDDRAFADIADILSAQAGGNSNLGLEPYPVGKMTDTVYAVDGGMEDWAYAASWEPALSPNVISKCEKSSTTSPIDPADTVYNNQSIRSMIYLVETSNSKSPPPNMLGSTDGWGSLTDKFSYGHIPINIKMCLTLADMLEPYIKLKTMEYLEDQNTLTIEWQGGGCQTVDLTTIEWISKEGDLPISTKSDPKKGPGYYGNSSHVYRQVIDLKNDNFNISLSIKLTCDQDWAKQTDPKPKVGAQSHLVRARTDQNYYAESNGYKVTGKKVVELKMEDITKDYLLRTRITNLKELELSIEFLECPTFSHVGSVSLHINSTSDSPVLVIGGNLNVDDPFVEGYLHEYGDTSRCLDSTGSQISFGTFQASEDISEARLFGVERDQIKTVKVNSLFEIGKEEDIVKLIGRGVVLEKQNHPDKIFVGQIVPVQPPSCKKAFEMKNCIGTDLSSGIGICTLNLILEDKLRTFNLFVEPSEDKKSVSIHGFAPISIIERYNSFDEIFIMNEKSEKKFFIKQKVGGYGLIEKSSFNLYPQIALGTLLRVYVQNGGDKMLVGDCSVGLKDPSFNDTANIINTISVQQQEKASAIRNRLLLVLVFCICVIVAGVIGLILWKKYKKSKQKTFEVVMTARKERYADTARQIGTARGFSSNRGGPSSAGGLSSVRDIKNQLSSVRDARNPQSSVRDPNRSPKAHASPRPLANVKAVPALYEKKGQTANLKTLKTGHMELPEEEEDSP